MSHDLTSRLDAAVAEGKLLPASRDNCTELLAGSANPLYAASVTELVDRGEWKELNDRFFKKLAFGTSGLRGRTIGGVITAAEKGNADLTDGGRPQFPCVGTNALNFYNLSRATRGLCKYLRDFCAAEGRPGRPSIVFSHDTRHFSREFAEYVAGIAAQCGCDAWLFPAHRPTPELSFAVRQLRATGGVMITASHNPYHDNGYKVYFENGDPIVDPQAPGILKEVNAITAEAFEPVPEAERGQVRQIGAELDAEYLQRLRGVMLQPALLEKARGLKIVYTPIHGTGGVFVPSILKDLGFSFVTVPEQDIPDGRFPTVKSPNPENAAALQMALDLAEKEKADIVIGTDPDCDRMAVAVRDRAGKMQLITGNQIGSLMAWYRTKAYFDLGILNEQNKKSAIIVKTFVTTGLQDAIADGFGVSKVNTLTGFKYIGGKLTKYEKELPADIQAKYRDLTDEESRAARLAHSRFYIFGGEESYGYMGVDWIRDKDGNGAVVMFAELAAYAASRGMTIPDLLDEVFETYGYFAEVSKDTVFPGADGAAQMVKLMNSVTDRPFEEIGGIPVTKVIHYGREDVIDEEGDQVPKENMIFYNLADGSRFAIRPSGTEPKIKVYFFGSRIPAPGEKLQNLAAVKVEVDNGLEKLWDDIRADMDRRLAV